MADEIMPTRTVPSRKKTTGDLLEDLRDRRSIRTMRERVAYCLMRTFVFVTIAVIAIILLNGFGVTTVPTAIVATLIAETIAHGIAMFFTVTRWLFTKN